MCWGLIKSTVAPAALAVPAKRSTSQVVVVHLHAAGGGGACQHALQLGQREAKQSQAQKTPGMQQVLPRVTARPSSLLQQLQYTQPIHGAPLINAPAAGGCSFCVHGWVYYCMHASQQWSHSHIIPQDGLLMIALLA
jgi:hypothetical protein